MKAALALFLFTLGAYGSIRDVDFKNFAYPFPNRKFIPVPSKLRWMPLVNGRRLSLRNGEYSFCADRNCGSLRLDRAEFGNIHGLEGTSAAVTVQYFSGGTATWLYLYVVQLQRGRPRVVAWLEAGSRADMGLHGFEIDHGDLVLILNDPDKRIGDCCSTGSITYRYRWMNGSFRQIGKPVRADDPPQ